MGEYLLRIATDILFYLAIFIPLIQTGPMAVRIVLVLVPAAWAVWVRMNWKQRDFMDALRDHFSLQVKLLAVLSPVEIFIIGLDQWTRMNAPMVVLFATVGILALKTGRIVEGNQGKGRFWLVCALELLAIVAAGFFFSSDAFTGGVLTLIGKGYHMLIMPILLFLIQVMVTVLEWIWPYVMAIFSQHEVRFQAEESFTITSGELDLELKQAERVAGAEVLKALGILIAIAAVVLFLWYLYRKFSQVSAERERRVMGTISHSGLSPQEMQDEKRPLFGGERNVRYYYRKFMELCKKQGGWGKGIVTTDHIHEAAREYWKDEESLQSLRQLYLSVRYGGYEDGAEERAQAKGIYKRLKSQLKENNEK